MTERLDPKNRPEQPSNEGTQDTPKQVEYTFVDFPNGTQIAIETRDGETTTIGKVGGVGTVHINSGGV